MAHILIVDDEINIRNLFKIRLENEKLTSLRDSLLPKLMSGELEVSDIDI